MAIGNNNGTGNTEGTMDIETMKYMTARLDRVRRHKIITKAEIKKCPALYETEHVADPIARVKLFNPTGRSTWYVTEYDADTGEAFGWVVGEHGDKALEYFNVYEIGSTLNALGIPLERDCHWTPKPLSECPNGRPARKPAPEAKAEAAMAIAADEIIKAAEPVRVAGIVERVAEAVAEAETLAFNELDCRTEAEREAEADRAREWASEINAEAERDAMLNVGPEDMSEVTVTETNNGRPMVLSRKTSAGWRVIETTNGEEIVLSDVRSERNINDTTTEYEMHDGTTYRVIRL